MIMKLHHEYKYELDTIYYDIPIAKCWLLYSYAMSNDPLLRFNGVKLNKSPMSVEAEVLTRELKQMLKQALNH